MAKDNSFDIVSTLDLQEIDNAVNQTGKEADTRYDLKATATEIEFDRSGGKITINSADEFALRSVYDVLSSKLVRREISLKALVPGKVETAPNSRVRQAIDLVQGISSEKAKEINRLIKDSKIKVNVAIEGDKLRVTSKSRDYLQEAINLVKESKMDIPLQFINFR